MKKVTSDELRVTSCPACRKTQTTDSPKRRSVPTGRMQLCSLGTPCSKLSAPCALRPGMTLVELVLGIGLLIVLLGAIFGFYQRSVDFRERGTNIASRTQLARVVLDQMASEIRRITPFVPQEFGVGGVEGNLREVTIATLVRPSRANFKKENYETANLVPDADLEFVRYYIRIDPDHQDENGNPVVLGLYRASARSRGLIYGSPSAATSQPAEGDLGTSASEAVTGASDPTAYIEEQVVSEQIQYLRVRYSDGSGWLNEWKTSSDPLDLIKGQMKQLAGGTGSKFDAPRLPMALEITIGFIPDYNLLLADLTTPTTATTEQDVTVTATNAPASDASTTASTADETEPHPDRFTIVVSLPMADKVYGPVSGKVGGTLSKFGSGAVEKFMQSQNSNLTSFSLDRSKGTTGGRSGPAGPLFGGEEQ